MNDQPGRMVHYTDNPNLGRGHARCFNAMIANVNPDGTLDLAEILTPSTLTPAYAVEPGDPGDLYRWHWPEQDGYTEADVVDALSGLTFDDLTGEQEPA